MTVQRWSLTLLGGGLSVLWFLYCVQSVRSAWGLVSLGLLLVMSVRVLVDTVDLCVGRWIRSSTPPLGPCQMVRTRRVIFEEITVEREAAGPLPRQVGCARWRAAAAPALARGHQP